MTFECRGIDLIEFLPGDAFSAASAASEAVFGSADGGEPVDLKEGDWAGYDEEGD